ncbi:MAG: GTP-binding protein [Candidatus Lokiarchaeota archaeon]|nr:GTP-binding protein [Candidatus Lokiarchaeota archaeon]
MDISNLKSIFFFKSILFVMNLDMLSSEISKLMKVTFIGSPAVGKTTMLRLLSKDIIDKFYFPTHGFDLKTIKLDDYHIRIWDFGGQQSYLKTYSRDYLLGSDILFVVTDSTPRNVLKSRELINYAAHFVDQDCPVVAIANKQDLTKNDGRMTPDRVEALLRVKTYGLTAINPAERTTLVEIIRKELNKIVIRKRAEKNEI